MKTLIVDDERLARNELRRLLKLHPQVEVTAEACNGEEALQLIDKLHPELLFLDIQMPGLSGFDLLSQLEDAPLVIFTTAFDHHAVKAFEANALDYLLKPIVPARLAAALARLPHRPTVAPASSAALPQAPPDRVFVRDGERCWLVTLADIVLFESEGNYTRVHFGKEHPLILRSLNALQERLDPALFFRASRQCIVNLKAIERVDQGIADNLILTLHGNHRVEMSRRQSARLREMLTL